MIEGEREVTNREEVRQKQRGLAVVEDLSLGLYGLYLNQIWRGKQAAGPRIVGGPHNWLPY